MFEKPQPKEKKKTIYPSSSNVPLYNISKAETLLARPYHRKLLKEIRGAVTAPPEYYEILYTQLINDFVEFVQLLPESNEGHVGGILNHGLLRAKEALIMGQDHENIEQNPLWTYVLFTSALLLDAGRTIADQQVMICRPGGKFIQRWIPLTGPMSESGSHYITRPLEGDTDGLARRATLLLARQLISKEALDWIASDHEALASWLALLTGHFDEARGDVCSILSVTKERIAQLLEAGQIPEEELWIDFSELLDTEYADEFLKWLRKGLDDQSISVNEDDSNVHVVEEGIFIEMPDATEEFLRHLSKPVDPALFYQQFNYIGITGWGENDYRYQKYVSEYPDVKAKRGLAGSASIATFGKLPTGLITGKAGEEKTHNGIVVNATKLASTQTLAALATNKNMKAIVTGGAGEFRDALLRAPGGYISPYSSH